MIPFERRQALGAPARALYMTSRTPLSRRNWIGAALTVIALGLIVHGLGLGLSSDARDATGDALWAMMMFAWIGALRPTGAMSIRAIVTLAICWTVEFSQAYHTPHLDAVRQTTIGRLVLGTGFDTRDLGAYAVGVLMACALESAVKARAVGARLPASRDE
jgi:hypothetical protein